MSLAELTHFTEPELLKRHGLDRLVGPFPCAVCSAPGGKMCLICCKSWYCSAEHQEGDLDTHQLNCSSPIEVQTNDAIGRHFVASRDLEAGELILNETPAFWSPRAEKGVNLLVYCLSCSLAMDADRTDFNRCTKCRWPVCNSACEKNSVHAEQECEFFARHEVPFPFPEKLDAHVTYKTLFLIRGMLLKESNPALWSDLQSLDDVAPKLGKIPLFPNLKKFKDIIRVPQDFGGNEDNWNKIQGIINVNGFWREMDSKCGNFIFLKTSIFAQSCAPNASWDLRISASTTSTEPRIRIRTNTRIKRGEIVGISYITDQPKKGTPERENAGFICRCPRCIDPTEFGTYNSAMKCPQNDCTGLLLPSEFPGNSNWNCNADGCDISMPYRGIMDICVMMYIDLQRLAIEDIEHYIDTELNKVFYTNHWIIIEASSRIVLETNLEWGVEKLRGRERDRFIHHCRKILKVYDVVIPGLSKQRGLVLRALGPPLLQKLNEDLTSENKLETLSEALKMYELLKEAFLALKDHPPSTPIPPDNYCPRDYAVLVNLNYAKDFIEALEVLNNNDNTSNPLYPHQKSNKLADNK